MKKLAICLAVLCLTLSGCGGQPAAGFSESDLTLTVAGKEYHTRDNIETVIEALGDGYRYAEGISPGASKADVLAAYGDPTEQDDYLLIYRASEEIGSPALCFELEGDTVTAVFLTVDPV